ncbi:hypothetical protein SLS62_001560 [Diatrype stigma]|uniref:Archaemetzincin-2 n=1 Tax=Diatrype stigma TaxID=117547 RepID=A0AAN9YVV9_9PEZI
MSYKSQLGRECLHRSLQLEPSPHAKESGFERQSLVRRLAATTKSGRCGGHKLAKVRGRTQPSAAAAGGVDDDDLNLSWSFPAPLVLPGDDLAWDPKSPPQSFRAWLHGETRNKPTEDRQTLYVAAAPRVTAGVAFMADWLLQPSIIDVNMTGGGESADADTEGGPKKAKKMKMSRSQSHTTTKPSPKLPPPPSCADVISYLSAFYHGMPVKPLPQCLRFVPWQEEKTTRPSSKKKRKRQKSSNSSDSDTGTEYIGLATQDDTATRIRVRPSPDGLFRGQLNLDDILDAAIEMLPPDAYALVLLVDHDMYEDDDDDFCCGRAYGGSRVAVVSSSRYHPALDDGVGTDHAHMWPASHCRSYVDRVCAAVARPAKAQAPAADPSSTATAAVSPIRAAIDAAREVSVSMRNSQEQIGALWFSRLARTVAHELGHCFGMAHCAYYACSMQGTAGMAEDVRQPPYFCPVCLGKLSHAVAGELLEARYGHGDGVGNDDDGRKRKYVRERYERIAEFCDGWKGKNGLFAGYEAWVRARLDLL